MRKMIAVTVGVVLCACAFSSVWVAADPPATTRSAPIDPRVKLYGRWDRRDAGRAVTVNSGSQVVARFEGSGISARFDVSRNQAPVPTLSWQIDDAAWHEAEVAPSVTLAAGLAAGPHRVTLIVRDLDEHQPRWSEPLTASMTFLGLDVSAGGALLDPPAEPKLKVEFLGDSITEGVLVHDVEPGKTTWPWRGDGRLAYAAQTALGLGAQWRQCGFGAQGVTHGGNGGVPSAPDAFDWCYQGCPRDDWQADVVVINQGTNDGGQPADNFRPAYRRLLEVIRKAYPKARIVALRPFNGAQAPNILAEVKARKDAGDEQVSFVDTTGWLDRPDFTDGVHPNVAGGAKAATKLIEALRKELEL